MIARFPSRHGRSDMALARLIMWFLSAICLVGIANASDVCRAPSFEGMSVRTEQIARMLGEDTSDPTKIRIYITREDGVPYIQSNFVSPDLDHPGKFADNPTKVRSGKIHDLDQALTNILFYFGADRPEGVAPSLPLDAHDQTSRALRSLTIFVDPDSLDRDGRPPIDLTGASGIRLATDHSSIGSGELELLPVDRPPPLLIERLSGCCFDGRPPGRGAEIKQKLTQQQISADTTVFLNMVIDSGTDLALGRSPTLTAAASRAQIGEHDSWATRLSKAMAASKGKTLILLGHISGADLVVEGSDSKPVFDVALWDLKEQARANNVSLLVFGCDTARLVAERSMGFGISGSINTVDAVHQLESGLKKATNANEFLTGLASPTLRVVADPSATVGKPVWATGLARARHGSFFVRVFRLFFFMASSHG